MQVPADLARTHDGWKNGSTASTTNMEDHSSIGRKLYKSDTAEKQIRVGM